MAFNSAAQIKQAVADLGHRELSALPAYVDNLVTKSLAKAYSEIRRRLRSRGYSMAQIDSWVDGAEFERDIALWWVTQEDGALTPSSPEFLKSLDRRCELDTVSLLDADGEELSPETGSIIGQGQLDDSDSTFYRTPRADHSADSHRW